MGLGLRPRFSLVLWSVRGRFHRNHRSHRSLCLPSPLLPLLAITFAFAGAVMILVAKAKVTDVVAKAKVAGAARPPQRVGKSDFVRVRKSCLKHHVHACEDKERDDQSVSAT